MTNSKQRAITHQIRELSSDITAREIVRLKSQNAELLEALYLIADKKCLTRTGCRLMAEQALKRNGKI